MGSLINQRKGLKGNLWNQRKGLKGSLINQRKGLKGNLLNQRKGLKGTLINQRKGLKGTLINRTFNSYIQEALETTRTVPLNIQQCVFFKFWQCNFGKFMSSLDHNKKHLCQILIFNFIKIRLNYEFQCFPSWKIE